MIIPEKIAKNWTENPQMMSFFSTWNATSALTLVEEEGHAQTGTQIEDIFPIGEKIIRIF